MQRTMWPHGMRHALAALSIQIKHVVESSDPVEVERTRLRARRGGIGCGRLRASAAGSTRLAAMGTSTSGSFAVEVDLTSSPAAIATSFWIESARARGPAVSAGVVAGVA
eukprot:gnl/TRDRNA2_/TRDRNA2_92289_c0_seq1.p2 gnl/TRDRNA2_/TRDRNA2_92289_c0~~gnl/TRDRNA2_/TRDRNA2_92289_c0_seq1.p2  ORF type:complete len:110 (+),score=10.27 gnl/TRDRNA2_/TRDRNA2_92289_c0_seq1:319-648(+)